MKPVLHQAIYIQLKRSYLMLGLLCVISISCCWILLAMPIAVWIKFFGILLVLSSSVYFILRDALLMLAWSMQILTVDSKGQLTLSYLNGQQMQPELADSCFIHPNLIILNFKRDGFKLAMPSVILLMDDSDEVRRLRVWLRWPR